MKRGLVILVAGLLFAAFTADGAQAYRRHGGGHSYGHARTVVRHTPSHTYRSNHVNMNHSHFAHSQAHVHRSHSTGFHRAVATQYSAGWRFANGTWWRYSNGTWVVADSGPDTVEVEITSDVDSDDDE